MGRCRLSLPLRARLSGTALRLEHVDAEDVVDRRILFWDEVVCFTHCMTRLLRGPRRKLEPFRRRRFFLTFRFTTPLCACVSVDRVAEATGADAVDKYVSSDENPSVSLPVQESDSPPDQKARENSTASLLRGFAIGCGRSRHGRGPSSSHSESEIACRSLWSVQFPVALAFRSEIISSTFTSRTDRLLIVLGNLRCSLGDKLHTKRFSRSFSFLKNCLLKSALGLSVYEHGSQNQTDLLFLPPTFEPCVCVVAELRMVRP